ncbi:hypothetical protein MNBD_PLANCTO02-2322 [hydrothermal vent metagenome]|uniref:Uncharacterized protein n=1 Tax=hydrothermal vent metagenome TaxID=652676 RepID=A0A3B1DGW0_9ZZZZ
MANAYPPTIIVVHPKERRKKCSVEPLRSNKDFVFWKFPQQGEEPLDGYVRLAMDGPLLGAADADAGLLVLDGTWRYAETMEKDYLHIPSRSLPVWETAYPRISKNFEDPNSGLATIEAIFAAYHLLNRNTTGLLDEYYWAETFLQKNKKWLSR